MSRLDPTYSPEVNALLDQERVIEPLPALVRARAMARARAALVAGGTPLRAPAINTVSRLRWAAAAALICMTSAAVGAAVYALHARRAPIPDARPAVIPVEVVPSPVRASVPVAVPVVAPVAQVPASPDLPAASERVVGAPHLSPADTARAELRLLRQARAAVAREDFAAALQPIAEHAHRFRAGRLVEEREALRVKALIGLGRTDEARRSAAEFKSRFPRSVLLPAVNRMLAPGQ